MKKGRHSKHQSIHKSSLSKLDTELLKHIEAKRRHRERMRKKGRNEEELIDAKERMEKRMEKKKKMRDGRKGHEKKTTHENGRKLVQVKRRAKEKHADRKSETPTKKSASPILGTSGPSDSELLLSEPSSLHLKHREEEEERKFSRHTSGFIPTSPSSPVNSKISEDDDQSHCSEPDHVDSSNDGSVHTNKDEDCSKQTHPDEQKNCGKHPICSKEGVHRAPDLLPAHCSYSEELLRLDPPTSPPVLSWQGSPVSDLDEDAEDENQEGIIGVLRRPVLQPSPTHSSPLRDTVDTSTGIDYCHSDLAKLYGLPEASKSMDIEEEDDEKQERDSKDGSPDPSSSQPNKPHLHQMDTSPNSTMGSHRYTYRGGPFGRPPPGSLVGVKYSSSLSLGPEIHPPEQQSPPYTSPTEDFPDQVAPALIQPAGEDKERRREGEEQEREKTEEHKEKEKEVDEDMEVNATESVKDTTCTSLEEKEPLSPATLQAKLAQSCELLLSQNSSPVSVAERKAVKLKGASSTEKETNQNEIRQRDHVRTQKRNAKGENQEKSLGQEIKTQKETSTPTLCSDGSDKKLMETRTKQVIPENQQNDKNKQEAEPEIKDKEKQIIVIKGNMNVDTVTAGTTSHMASGVTRTQTSCTITAAGRSPLLERVNLLEPNALSKIPLKELKIKVIKLKSGDRKTFIASEIEQKSIPLNAITIRNNASEIIRACK